MVAHPDALLCPGEAFASDAAGQRFLKGLVEETLERFTASVPKVFLLATGFSDLWSDPIRKD